MTSHYQELAARIKLVARDEQQERQYKQLVLEHFEGKRGFYQLPEPLGLVVMLWEHDIIERGLDEMRG